MKKMKWKRIVSLFLAAILAVTSLTWDGIAAYAKETVAEDGVPTREEAEDPSISYLDPEDVGPENERKEERTANRTVYDLGGNKRMEVLHGSDVRYQNSNGKWVDYDPSLIPVEKKKSGNGVSLKGYAYTNKAGDKKQYLPEKLSKETPVRLEHEGYGISFYPVTALESETNEEAEGVTRKEQENEESEEEGEPRGLPGTDIQNGYALTATEEAVTDNAPEEGTAVEEGTGDGTKEDASPFEMNSEKKEAATEASEDKKTEESAVSDIQEENEETLTETGEDPNAFTNVAEFGSVSVEEETYVDAYDQESLKPLKAVYEDFLAGISLEYESSDIGVKENIILDEVPEQNAFTFEFRLSGVTVRHNATTEGLTFYDRSTGEMVAAMDVPNMNDATGEAYSEAVTTQVEKKEGETDTYLVTLTADRDYLDSEERVYPVTVDPTVTWTGTGTNPFQSVYICNGSSYKDINFNDSGIKCMSIGDSQQGLYRTLLFFPDLAKTVKGYYVDSATMELWETDASTSGETVKVVRISESWKLSTVTWNTRPAFPANGVYTTFNSTGTSSKKTVNVTKFVRDVANGSITNYGLVLKAGVETGSKYVQLANSRYATTSKRPKLTVVYYDPPARPTKLTLSHSVMKPGTTLTTSWEGITSKSLNRVEYRVAKWDPVNEKELGNLVEYSSATKIGTTASGSATITDSKNWPAGVYKFIIHGVDNGGIVGVGAGKVFTIDGTAPTLAGISLTPSTSQASYSKSQTLTLNWSGASDNVGLSRIEYRVNGGNYNSTGSAAASGSAAITPSLIASSGTYTIGVRAVDKAGNVSSEKIAYFYKDATAPSMKTVTLSVSGPSANGYAADDSPKVTVSEVTESHSGIVASGVKYAIVSKGAAAPADDQYVAASNVNFTKSSNPYAYTCTVSLSGKGSGLYDVYIRTTDKAGNTSSAGKVTVGKDVTDPDGTITISNGQGNNPVSVTGTMNIDTTVKDDHSGVKTAGLILLDSQGTQVGQPLFTNVTTNKTVSYDTTALDNGAYTLKLTIEDQMGRKKTVTRSIQIANRMEAPAVSESYTSDGQALISWEFSSLPGNLKEVEYLVTGSETWTKVPDSAGKTGSASVVLPTTEEGIHVIKIRGVDTAGVAGKESQIRCILDKTGPLIQIDSFKQGHLNGSVSDQYLKSWELTVQEKGAEEWSEITQGTENMEHRLLASIDMESSVYQENTWYTLSLTAEDKAGNRRTEKLDFYKNGTEAGTLKDQQFAIRTTGDSQAGELWKFTGSESFSLEKTGNLNLSDIDTVSWYVDGIQEAGQTGTTLEKDFSDTDQFPEGSIHTILALVKMQDGKEYLSSPVYENIYASSENVSGQEEKVFERIHLTKQLYSILLETEEEKEEGQSIRYYAKTETGEYVEIEPGRRYPVSELSDAQSSESIVLKAAFSGTETGSPKILSYRLTYETVEEQSFQISLFEKYRPKNLSAQDKINYKTYVKWETQEGAGDGQDVSFELYRGTERDFTPDEAHLVAEDIKTNFWSDVNLYYSNGQEASGDGQTFYYKVRAVEKDSSGKVARESMFSNVASSRAVDANEYAKRLGSQEYWGYTDFNTPNGDGAVEMSQGNFYYSQQDAALPNSQLEFGLLRSYNSQSSAKTSFGTGWDHNYNLELLNLVDAGQMEAADSREQGELIYKDGTGTIYRFVPEKGKEGSYHSQEDEYVTLARADEEQKSTVRTVSGTGQEQTYEILALYTMKTKDGREFRFDRMGKIVYESEPNGTFLLFTYDDQKGFLQEVITDKGQKLTLTYQQEQDGDCALVKSIRLPDGTELSYQYVHEETGQQKRNYRLASMTHKGTGEGETTTYAYEYDEAGTLTEIHDAMGNPYGITYSGQNAQNLKKAVKLTQPSGEYITLTYEDGQTLSGKYTEENKKLYETSASYNGSGYVTKESDAFGNEKQITYTDGMVTSVTYPVSSQSLDKATGKVENKEEIRTEMTEYGQRKNPVRETDALGNTILSTYENESPAAADLPTHVVEEGYDGLLLSEEEYRYDEDGNEIYSYDGLEGEETVCTYDDDGNVILEKEYEYDDPGDGSTDKNGSKTQTSKITFQYDDSGNVTREEEQNPSQTVTTNSTYDAMGRIIRSESVTVPKDGEASGETVTETVETAYDYMGRETGTTVTRTKGNRTSTETTEKNYDRNGTLIYEKAKDGTETSYTYDSMNRLVKRTVEKGDLSRTYTTEYGYAEDLVIQEGGGRSRTVALAETVTEKQGTKVLSISYKDGKGRLIRETASGITTDYTYDKDGKEIVSCTEGKTTVKVYDEAGNIIHEIEQPEVREENGKTVYYAGEDSIVTSASYDSRGNKKEETDGEGTATIYQYRETDGKLASVSLKDTAGTQILGTYGYETAGGITTTILTDALNKKSITVTDAEGKETSVKDLAPDDTSITTRYEYDGEGQKIKETYEDGSCSAFTYDASGQLIRQETFLADGTKEKVTRYEYDQGTDLLLAMKDYRVENGEEQPVRYTGYAYDSFGRTTGYTEVDGTDSPSETQKAAGTVSYTYNEEDELTEVTYPESEDSLKGLLFTYNEYGWLTKIRVKMSGTILDGTLREYTYHSDGRVETIRDYTGFDSLLSVSPDYILREYAYDDFDRVTSMTYRNGKDQDQVLESYAYTYDRNGNILTEQIKNNTPQAEAERTDELRTHTYDSRGQLIKTVYLDNKTQSRTTVLYTYDQAGNRKSMTAGETTTAYTYNGLHQLTKTVEQQGETVLSDTAYTYDTKGNETKETDSIKGTETVYAYDVQNQLIRAVKKTGDVTDFTQTSCYNGAGQRIRKTEKGKTTHYFYDQGTVLYTLDGSGEKTSHNLLGLSGSVAASRRYEGEDGDPFFLYNKDIKGSTTSILKEDLSGAVSYVYDDFGVTEQKGDTVFYNEVCYTGGIYDDSTALYYLNARYYDPSIGRFLSEDTYRGEAENADTWHLYVYCANNPVNYVDPSGHSARAVSAITGAIVGVAVDVALNSFIYFIANNGTLKDFNYPANKIAKAAFSGLVDGILVSSKLKRNAMAVASAAKAALMSYIGDRKGNLKSILKRVLRDAAIGGILGYIGGEGIGRKYWNRGLFRKGSYSYKNVTITYGGVVSVSSRTLAAKKIVVKECATSLAKGIVLSSATDGVKSLLKKCKKWLK